MPKTDTALFYQLYFQTPGVAEAELERDPKTTHPSDAVRSFRRCAARHGGAFERPASAWWIARRVLGGMRSPGSCPLG